MNTLSNKILLSTVRVTIGRSGKADRFCNVSPKFKWEITKEKGSKTINKYLQLIKTKPYVATE